MCLTFQESEKALPSTLPPAIVNTITPASSMRGNGNAKAMTDHRKTQRLKGTYN